MRLSVQGAAVVPALLAALAVMVLPARGRQARDRLRAARGAARTAAVAAPELRPATPDPAELAEQLASAFRSGLPPARVWDVLAARHGPLSTLASAVAMRTAAGVPAGRALRDSAGPGGGGLAPVAVVLDLCERAGAPAADVLAAVAAGLRAESAAATEVGIALAAPKATASVMTLLPLAGLGLGALLGVDTLHVLLATPAGHACLLIGGLLWAGGRWWIRRLVSSAQSAGDGDP